MTETHGQHNSSTKIQGKFYPLQHEEWIRACNELKSSERDVLYYIRTADPYSNGLDVNVTAIASALNRNKGTVSRALKVLEAKGFIDLELVQVKVKVTGLGIWCSKDLSEEDLSENNAVVPTQRGCPHTTPVVSTQHQLSPHNASCLHTTPVVSTQPYDAETLTEQDSQDSKTIKTYSEFKKTLSDTERENFEKFVREEYYKDTGKKIRSFTAFMSNDHFQEWLEIWNNRPEAVQATTANKWQNHPQFENWLSEIERTLNPFEFAGSDKEKQSFIDWCWETKQYSWLKEEGDLDGL